MEDVITNVDNEKIKHRNLVKLKKIRKVFKLGRESA